MKYLLWPVLFFTHTVIADSMNEQLEALQQLRSLIPERVWFQEFSIQVDTQGFEEEANLSIGHQKRASCSDSLFAVGRSRDYFLFSTLSGENVRILDRYVQFEQSPFWRTPDLAEKLERLEGGE